MPATGVTTNIVGHANDTVLGGKSGSLAGINGALNVENLSGSTFLAVDGSTDSGGRTVTFSNIGTNPNDFEHNSTPWGQISGLSPQPINYEFADTGTIVIGAVAIVAVIGVMVVARRWRSHRPSEALADLV